jgi:hypothetical protein
LFIGRICALPYEQTHSHGLVVETWISACDNYVDGEDPHVALAILRNLGSILST